MKKLLGEVMGLEVSRDANGGVWLNQEQLIITGDEDPEEFCRELADLVRKTPEQKLVDGLALLVAEGERVLLANKLEALLNDYRKAVGK